MPAAAAGGARGAFDWESAMPPLPAAEARGAAGWAARRLRSPGWSGAVWEMQLQPSKSR